MKWNSNVVVKENEKDAIIVHPERGTFRKINGSGLYIVKLLKGSEALERSEIMEEISQRFELPVDLFKEEIDIFLDDLASDYFIYDEDFKSVKPVADTGITEQGLWLKLTNRCNLLCTYCYADSCASDSSDEITINEIETVLKAMAPKNLSKIVLTGGEPLLRKDIVEIAQLCKTYGLVQILTNGTMPSLELHHQLLETVDMIQISLDSMDKEENDLNRGIGTFDKVMKTVDYLCEIDASKLTLSMTIVPGKEDSITEMIDYCHSKKIQQLHINRFVPYGRAKLNFDQELNLKKFYAAVDIAYTHIQKIMVKDKAFRLNLDVANDFVKSVFGKGLKKGCGLRDALISVECNGDIFMCSSLHSNEFKLGSIRDSQLEKILSEPSCHLGCLNVDALTECKECAVKYFCGGACRALAVSENNDIYGVDGNCTIYKERIYDLMARV